MKNSTGPLHCVQTPQEDAQLRQKLCSGSHGQGAPELRGHGNCRKSCCAISPPSALLPPGTPCFPGQSLLPNFSWVHPSLVQFCVEASCFSPIFSPELWSFLKVSSKMGSSVELETLQILIVLSVLAVGNTKNRAWCQGEEPSVVQALCQW